jgi:two-component system sensor histidine kinase HydH
VDSRLLLRLVLPSAGLGLLLLAVGLLGAWYVHRMHREVSAVLELNVASVRAAEELEISVRQVQTEFHHFLLTDDARHLAAIPRLTDEVARLLDVAERLATTSEEQNLIVRARTGFVRFRAEFEEAVNGADPPSRLKATRPVVNGLIERDILPPVHAYLKLNEATVEAAARDNQDVADRMVPALIMLGACGCTAGLLAGFGLARGVARSIVQLSIPIRDAAGKLSEAVGPITVSAGARIGDLEQTMRRMAAEVETVVGRLQEAQREILHREQLAAVGQLAAGVAHELRNPLTAIKVLVQVAARRPEEPVLRGEKLGILLAEIGRLEQIIQTFLDFARPARPEKRPFPADAAVRETLALVDARAREQGAQLIPILPAGQVMVEADPGQFRQLLLNLLLNALDAIGDSGTIEVRLRPEPDGWLVLEVSDDGPGLPADLGDRIFDPFVSTKETGTGLGLSICRRVAEVHGGDVRAAGRPGGGAVFTARFPAAAAGPVGEDD